MWGIDMIGEIRPTASNGHRFILVAIDYFMKWVEAASFSTVTKNVVAWFIRQNLIYRYGVLERIITDNGTNCKFKISPKRGGELGGGRFLTYFTLSGFVLVLWKTVKCRK